MKNDAVPFSEEFGERESFFSWLFGAFGDDCRHRWTRWSEPWTEVNGSLHYWQKRKCLECGKVQAIIQ